MKLGNLKFSKFLSVLLSLAMVITSVNLAPIGANAATVNDAKFKVTQKNYNKAADGKVTDNLKCEFGLLPYGYEVADTVTASALKAVPIGFEIVNNYEQAYTFKAELTNQSSAGAFMLETETPADSGKKLYDSEDAEGAEHTRDWKDGSIQLDAKNTTVDVAVGNAGAYTSESVKTDYVDFTVVPSQTLTVCTTYTATLKLTATFKDKTTQIVEIPVSLTMDKAPVVTDANGNKVSTAKEDATTEITAHDYTYVGTTQFTVADPTNAKADGTYAEPEHAYADIAKVEVAVATGSAIDITTGSAIAAVAKYENGTVTITPPTNSSQSYTIIVTDKQGNQATAIVKVMDTDYANASEHKAKIEATKDGVVISSSIDFGTRTEGYLLYDKSKAPEGVEAATIKITNKGEESVVLSLNEEDLKNNYTIGKFVYYKSDEIKDTNINPDNVLNAGASATFTIQPKEGLKKSAGPNYYTKSVVVKATAANNTSTTAVEKQANFLITFQVVADIAAPKATLTVGKNTETQSIDTLYTTANSTKFNKFADMYKSKQTVTIDPTDLPGKASDGNTGVGKVSYYVSNTLLKDEAAVKAITAWTELTANAAGKYVVPELGVDNTSTQYVVYAKVEDKATAADGTTAAPNVAYYSTNGFTMDLVAPTIEYKTDSVTTSTTVAEADKDKAYLALTEGTTYIVDQATDTFKIYVKDVNDLATLKINPFKSNEPETVFKAADAKKAGETGYDTANWTYDATTGYCYTFKSLEDLYNSGVATTDTALSTTVYTATFSIAAVDAANNQKSYTITIRNNTKNVQFMDAFVSTNIEPVKEEVAIASGSAIKVVSEGGLKLNPTFDENKRDYEAVTKDGDRTLSSVAKVDFLLKDPTATVQIKHDVMQEVPGKDDKVVTAGTYADFKDVTKVDIPKTGNLTKYPDGASYGKGTATFEDLAEVGDDGYDKEVYNKLSVKVTSTVNSKKETEARVYTFIVYRENSKAKISVNPQTFDFTNLKADAAGNVAEATEDYTADSLEVKTVTVKNEGNRILNIKEPVEENGKTNYVITKLTKLDKDGKVVDGDKLYPKETATFTVTPKVGLGIGQYKEVIVVTIASIEDGEDKVIIDEGATFVADFRVKRNNEKTYDVTATAGEGGVISPAALKVTYAAETPITVTPNTGYELDKLTVNGEDVTKDVKDNVYTLKEVEEATEVKATFKKLTYKVTATVGDNGKITNVGEKTVEYGAVVAYTITPDEGYVLAAVTVDDKDVTADVKDDVYTTAAIAADTKVNVTFKKVAYTITATAGENGTIDPVGETAVGYGENKVYTITPAEGYAIADVKVNGKSVGAVETYTVANVKENVTIEATFTKAANKITATVAAGKGTINPTAEVLVATGADKAFDITPAKGYVVEDVKVNGESVGAVLSYKFENVTADQTIEVSFKIATFTVEAQASSNGTISAAGETTVDYGTDVTYTFTPNTGYTVNTVTVNGKAVTAKDNAYTIANITKDTTINVTFKKLTYTITATAVTGMGISSAGKTTVSYGASKKYSVKAKSGYAVTAIKVNGKTVQRVTASGENVSGAYTATQYYTIANVKANQTITATVIKINKGDTIESGNYAYKVTKVAYNGNGTVAMTGFAEDKFTAAVNTPKTVKIKGVTFKVTEVAKNAFRGTEITSAVINDNVTTIGYASFAEATSLKKVTIGDKVKTIGKHAFCSDPKLTKIVIKSTKLTTDSVAEHVVYNVTATVYVPKDKLRTYKNIFAVRQDIGKGKITVKQA